MSHISEAKSYPSISAKLLGSDKFRSGELRDAEVETRYDSSEAQQDQQPRNFAYIQATYSQWNTAKDGDRGYE